MPQLNALLGLKGPATDCGAAFGDPATALPAGAHGMVNTSGLSRGTHLYECMIHPWMRARVTVRVG